MKRARAQHVVRAYNYSNTHTTQWMALVKEYSGDARDELWALYCRIVHGNVLEPPPPQLVFDAKARSGIVLSTPSEVYMVYCGKRVAYLTHKGEKYDWPVSDHHVWPHTAAKRVFVSPSVDAWTLICAHLNVYDVLALGCTCSRLCDLVRRDRIWQPRYAELQACVPAINAFAKPNEPLHRVYARLVNYNDKKRAPYNRAWMPLLLALSVPFGLQAPFQQINSNHPWQSRGFPLQVSHNPFTHKLQVMYDRERSKNSVPFRSFKQSLDWLLWSPQGCVQKRLLYGSSLGEWPFFKKHAAKIN